jgi:hypothetical protein
MDQARWILLMDTAHSLMPDICSQQFELHNIAGLKYSIEGISLSGYFSPISHYLTE